MRVRQSTGLLAGIVLAQLLYPRVPARRQTAATGAIVGLMGACACASLTERRGRRAGLALAGCAALTGTVAEVIGVRTGRPFGRYAYSGRLGPRVAGVAAGVPVAWTMTAPAAWTVGGLLAGRSAAGDARGPAFGRRAQRVAWSAGALTAWDLFLDPRMVRDGYWTWVGGGRYRGVPLSNYAGWLLTSGVLFGVWSLVDGEGEPADVDLALYAWTWIGEAVANVLFWHDPVVAAVGGLGMGAFAVPALRARLRP